MSSSPETVSTDFSVLDKSYFEPLTLEDIMNMIDLEDPIGAIVQSGGQTAINLAEPLTKQGAKILGATIEDLNRTESRDLFEQISQELVTPQPPGDTTISVGEAVVIADHIGYPILVRPNYALGGCVMEIVEDQKDLEGYMRHAAKAFPGRPVLADSYLLGQECEVDATCDGEIILIPGIMEHIERAGVHPDDSMAVYPPQYPSQEIQAAITDYTKELALGLSCVGMMNVQLVIHENRIYVIEVNPRASRTVLFLSKITGIPMAQVAARAILSEKLTDLGYQDGLYPESEQVHVKAPVLSFTKLQKVDMHLGPEMKSTGEAMSSDYYLEKALYRAFEVPGLHLPSYGAVLFTIADETKEEALGIVKCFSAVGYGLIATEGTADFLAERQLPTKKVTKTSNSKGEIVLDVIRNGSAQVVINTMNKSRFSANRDRFSIRREAVEYGIPLFTSLDIANTILKVLESRAFTAGAIQTKVWNNRLRRTIPDSFTKKWETICRRIRG